MSLWRGCVTRYYRLIKFAALGQLMLAAFLLSQSALAGPRVSEHMLTLYEGQSRVISVPGVVRMSVGKSDMVSSTLLQSGEVVLIAEEKGETNIHFWFDDGSRETVSIIVVESNTWRESLEVKSLLRGIEGLDVRIVGQRIVVDGQLEARDLQRVKTVKERYSDLLILAREITPYEQKMLYFDVQVTEINRDVTEELGINWSKSFPGPSIGYEKAWKHNELGMPANAAGVVPSASAFQAATSIVDTALGAQIDGNYSIGQQRQLLKAQGDEYMYWGIGTTIVSMINLLEQSGAAITLSQPQLSARSGGAASLTVGGEVPVVTSSVSGQTVSYKDYGIILNIQPNIDMYENITARVSVSVSQLDLSNAVDGQPAFKKRFTENDIKLNPGETLALSGLITREEQIAYSGLKWLSDIPILGPLFKSKSFTKGETELVILLTPKVVEDLASGDNQRLVEKSQKLIKEFESRVIELID